MKKTFYFIILFILISLFMHTIIFAQDSKAEKMQIKPALLVIDIQNEFLKYMSEDDKKLGMEVINGVIYTFRQHNLPIIRIYHTDPNWGPKPGTEAFEFPKSVIIQDDDPKVIKNFPSAFQKTDLDKILKEKGCNTLFLCGLSSVGCVLATYFGGMEREYRVFMLKEGIMSHNSDYTNVIRDICETVSFDTMTFILQCMK